MSDFAVSTFGLSQYSRQSFSLSVGLSQDSKRLPEHARAKGLVNDNEAALLSLSYSREELFAASLELSQGYGVPRSSAVQKKPSASMPPEVKLLTDDKKELPSGPTADAQLNAYIYFLASLASQKNGEDFERKVAELASKLDAIPSGDGSDGTSISKDGSVSVSREEQAGMLSSSSGSFLGVQASASVSASFSVSIKRPDGTEITVEATMESRVDVSAFVAQLQGQTQQEAQGDPLALDLDGDNQISLSNVAQGVNFDLNADSELERSAFVSGADVFLALDRNSNGRIDDGGELFGDQHGTANGFLELAKFDDDHNGVIDSDDLIFSALLGVRLDAGGLLESTSLQSLNVQAINLSYTETQLAAQGGNSIAQCGSALRADGSTMLAADVLLNYRTLLDSTV